MINIAMQIVDFLGQSYSGASDVAFGEYSHCFVVNIDWNVLSGLRAQLCGFFAGLWFEKYRLKKSIFILVGQ